MELTSGLYLGRIPYVRVGAGSNPLVVLNGGQAFVRRPSPERSGRDARRIASLLPDATDFVLLGYDVAPPAHHCMDRIVADVAQIVGAHFGSSRIVGISYGGMAGLRLAAAHPHLVTNLVVLASAHDFSIEGRARILRQVEFALKRDFEALVNEFAAVFRRPWLNWMLSLRLRLDRRRLAETMNEPEIIVRGLNAVLNAASLHRTSLHAITARALVIGGSRDQFFGDGRMQETAAHMRDVRLSVLEGETHMVPVERRRRVAAEIAAFLAL